MTRGFARHPRSPLAAGPFVFLLGAALFCGCGGGASEGKGANSGGGSSVATASRASDCKALGEKLDAVDTEAARLSPGDDAGELPPFRELGAVLGRVAGELDGLKLEDPGVRALAGDFASYARESSKVMPQVGEKLDRLRAAAAALEPAADRFKQSAEAFADYCAESRSKECGPIGAHLKTMPRMKGAEYAVKMEAWLAEAKKITVSDPTTKKHVAAMLAALGDVRTAAGDLDRLKLEIDTAIDPMKERGEALDRRAKELCGRQKTKKK